MPIYKDVDANADDGRLCLQLYLANVEAFVNPIAVIPDLRGPPNAYFWVKDRDSWAIKFTGFLERDMDLSKEISVD